ENGGIRLSGTGKPCQFYRFDIFVYAAPCVALLSSCMTGSQDKSFKGRHFPGQRCMPSRLINSSSVKLPRRIDHNEKYGNCTAWPTRQKPEKISGLLSRF
ncbi:TPA: hypothetical protein ACNP0X_005254, partial [Enterobacter asburiae]